MRGEATPAQLGGLLLALRVKGETAEEVAGAARALRAAMIRVPAAGAHLVDTCGTGGGAITTFNISTAAAFVAAGARAPPGEDRQPSFSSHNAGGGVVPVAGVRAATPPAPA